MDKKVKKRPLYRLQALNEKARRWIRKEKSRERRWKGKGRNKETKEVDTRT